MDIEIVGKFLSTLPEDDDHPYRTGPWRPQTTEWRADDLAVVEGELPADLDGVYLRNTENPLHPALKSYHPFDGDGMLHIVGFRDGKAFYRNRFVRTDGFEAENAAGGPLWPGLAEPLSLAKVDHGWGARTLLKDASSTDVVVHRGTALTSFYQCGDLYRVDPYTGNTLGKEDFNGGFPSDWGVSAHPKVDERTDEMLFFNYSKKAPYMHYGVVDRNNELVHYTDIPLPGPRLPHDMAFTRNYVILNDFPLFWDPELLERDLHVARFHRDMPSRFAVLPRRGRLARSSGSKPTPPTCCTSSTPTRTATRSSWTGSSRVSPNPPTTAPEPSGSGPSGSWPSTGCRPACTAGGSTCVTGGLTEEPLSDTITEFGMINAGHGGEPYRYTYAATGKPGWFLFDGLVRHDVVTGTEQRISFGDGVYGSETAMAPRVGSRAEDDGYLVTITTDMNADASYCLVFDAARLEDGPVCKLQLPERVSSGTHSTWVAGDALRRWHTAESAAEAIGL